MSHVFSVNFGEEKPIIELCLSFIKLLMIAQVSLLILDEICSSEQSSELMSQQKLVKQRYSYGIKPRQCIL